MFKVNEVVEHMRGNRAFVNAKYYPVRLLDPNTLISRDDLDPETRSIGVTLDKQSTSRTWGGKPTTFRYSLSIDVMAALDEPYSVVESLSDDIEKTFDNFTGTMGKTYILQSFHSTTVPNISENGGSYVNTIVFDVNTRP